MSFMTATDAPTNVSLRQINNMAVTMSEAQRQVDRLLLLLRRRDWFDREDCVSTLAQVAEQIDEVRNTMETLKRSVSPATAVQQPPPLLSLMIRAAAKKTVTSAKAPGTDEHGIKHGLYETDSDSSELEDADPKFDDSDVEETTITSSKDIKRKNNSAKRSRK